MKLIREPLRTLLDFVGDPHWIVTSIICVLVLVSLQGCAPPVVRSVTGTEVSAPAGFVIYCQTSPSRVECGGGQ